MKGSPWHAWSLLMQLLYGTCLQMDRFFFITHNTKYSLATQRIPMTCGFLRQHTELPTLLPKKRASSNSCFRGSRLCRFTLLSITTQPTKQRKTMTIHSHLHLNMRPFNKRSNVLAKCQLEISTYRIKISPSLSRHVLEILIYFEYTKDTLYRRIPIKVT